jgi:hypothetical protein
MNSVECSGMATDMKMTHAERSATAAQLGFRLGVDVLAAGTAALSITPIVCLIDRYGHWGKQPNARQ